MKKTVNKTPVTEAQELTLLDGDIQHEKETRSSLEAKLATAINDRDLAAFSQRQLAYLAHADGKNDALTKLELAEQSLAKAHLQVSSIQIALESCQTKLADLCVKREKAFQQSKLSEYRQASDLLIILGEDKIEIAASNLRAATGEVSEHLRKMDALAYAAGIEAPPHRNIAKTLRHAIGYRLGLNETWMSTASRQQFSKPISLLFDHVLNGTPIDDSKTQRVIND